MRDVSASLLALALLAAPALASPPATCVVSGTVLNISANPVPNTVVRFRVVQPTIINGNAIAAQDLTALTDVSGNWSLTLIQGLNAQVDIPAAGTPVSSDTVIPTGASCPATFASLTLYTRGTLTPATILSNAGPSMGGDLTGASPSPSVVGLRGVQLTAGTPTNGQGWLYSSGTGKYVLTTIGSGTVTSVTAGTGINMTGSGTAPVVNVATGGITSSLIGAGAASTNVGTLGGALSGTLPSPALATGAAAANLGGAGGVLAGTYPSPSFAAGAISDAAVNAGAAIGWSKISKAGAAESDIPGLVTDLADKFSKSTGGTVAGNSIFNGSVAVNGAFSFSGGFAPAGEIRVARTADATSGVTLKPSNNLTLEGSVWTTVAERRLTAWVNTPTGTNAGHMSLMGYSTDNVLGTEKAWLDTVTGAFNGNVIGNVTGAVTGNVTGNASGTAASFTGNLTGDVTSTGMSTTVALVNGSTAANVHAAELLANAATAANTASTIMKRDGSNQVAATTFTGNLTGNVTGNAGGTAANVTGVVVVANGGTGASTLTGVLHGNGTSAITGAAASLTADVSGILPVANGGTGQSTASAAFSALDPMTLLGDTMYGGASGVATALAGNTTTTPMFLTQTGNGAVSAAPSWAALVAANIPNHDFSKVTTGTVPIAQGGTGQTTANPAFNALSPLTTVGDILYEDATPKAVRLAGNSTTTKQFYTSTGTGAAANPPALTTIAAGDVPNLDAAKITTGTLAGALLPALAGDVTGAPGTNTVARLQGRNVAATAPTNNYVLTWVTGSNDWEPQPNVGAGPVASVSGSGGTTGLTLTGGPTGAVTLTLGGTLSPANGGTGGANATAGFNGLSPMTTLGDTIYGGASGTGTRLGGNTTTNGMFLHSVGSGGLATAPLWSQVGLTTDVTGTLPVANGGTGAATLTGLLRGNGTSAISGAATVTASTEISGLVPVANGGTNAGAFTLGSVVFAGTSGTYTQDNSNLFWDSTNKRLGIGTATPASPLEVRFATGPKYMKLGEAGTSRDIGLGWDVANQRGLVETNAYGYDIWFNGGAVALKTGTGHLGVGNTTAPGLLSVGGVQAASTLPLTVAGTSNYPTLNTATGIADIWGNASNALTIGADVSSPYAIWLQARQISGASYPGASFSLALNPLGGNVGVGTMAPTSALHVTSASNTAPTVDLYATGTTGVTGTLRVTSPTSGAAVNAIAGTNGTGLLATGNASGIAVNVTGGAGAPAMYVTPGGVNANGIIVINVNGQTADPFQLRTYDGYANGGFTAQGAFYTGGTGGGGSFGATSTHGYSIELLTLNTGGTTTDTTANLLPANSVIKAVTIRVTQAITVASAFSVGDPTTAARFVATGTGLTIGSTAVGLVHVDQTGAAGPRQTAAAKVRITTTGTPSAGQVRIVVFYETYAAPTS